MERRKLIHLGEVTMWKIEDECYFVISNMIIEKATVKKFVGGLIQIQTDYGKTINLRESRLYRTYEEADQHRRKPPKKNQYDYMMME